MNGEGDALPVADEIDGTIATQIIDEAPWAIVVTDPQGRVIWRNRTMKRYMAVEGAPAVATLLEGDEPIALPDGTGATRWLMPARWDTEEDGGRQVHYFLDITRLHLAERRCEELSLELERLITHDSVTGLPNRRALIQGLDPLVSRSRRYGNALSLIRLRVDDPRDLEAVYGHGAGELVLIRVAQTLKDQMRWADLIGRLEGGDFLLVLPETDVDSAGKLATKLVTLLAELKITTEEDQQIHLTPRLGVCGWQKGNDTTRLLRRAEECLEKTTEDEIIKVC